ncbi:MAG TPA: antibiotic biosynthesis monooxygenase family protein [Sphingobium sp.]
MILERVELTAKDGHEDAFAAVFDADTLALISGAPGCLGARVGRGVENPGKMILLVEWETLDAHTAFTGSPPHGAFGKAIGPYIAGGAMEHFSFD